MKIHFIIIGGGWYVTASVLRAPNRVRYDPSVRSRYLGFRLVKG